MKILVTGGAGFLGRHIVDKLLESGYNQITILSRGHYPELEECGLKVISTDLANKDKLITACDGIDTIFHVASKTGICGRFNSYYQTNVTGTRNLLQAAGLRGVKNFIYTSTPSVVYGNHEIINGDEELPYPRHYLTFYAATKAEAELMVLSYNGRAGLRTCALRPHLIFGPGDTNLTPRIINKGRNNKLRIVGTGKNLVSVSYVENTADAHICAMRKLCENSKAVCGKAFFINENDPVNCWDFINKLLISCNVSEIKNHLSFSGAYTLGFILEKLGHYLAPNWEPPMTRFLALQLATSHYFNNTGARTALDWTPHIQLSEAINKTAAHFTKNQ